MNPYQPTTSGLYVHIPFCKTKCIYCDFYSRPDLSVADAVVDNLIREWNERAGELSTARPDTIYIGGGTPSALPRAAMQRLLQSLPVEWAAETTVEANPDDITPDLVAFWRDMGVNRVSVGVQSLDDNQLRWMHRRHDSGRALRALDCVQHGGIGNVSADLIYGLPGLTPDAWQYSLTTLMKSGIQHLSAYCLTYTPGTPLYDSMERGELQPAGEVAVESQFNALRRIALDYGWEHYEISNLSLPGWHSRHNSLYWSRQGRWLGIGPAAHSFDGQVRRANPCDTARWLKAAGKAPTPEEESSMDIINDWIVAGLRTSQGVDLDALPQDARDVLLRQVSRHIALGDMHIESDRWLSIVPDRWLVSNTYMRDAIIG